MRRRTLRADHLSVPSGIVIPPALQRNPPHRPDQSHAAPSVGNGDRQTIRALLNLSTSAALGAASLIAAILAQRNTQRHNRSRDALDASIQVAPMTKHMYLLGPEIA
jgi:hypothetical protein